VGKDVGVYAHQCKEIQEQGVEVRAYNLRQEDLEFKARLGYIAGPGREGKGRERRGRGGEGRRGNGRFSKSNQDAGEPKPQSTCELADQTMRNE
jgi:hypothetical protein